MRPLADLLHLFFPSSCIGCETRVGPGTTWCVACQTALVSGLDSACPRCGLIWLDPPPEGGRHHCGDCQQQPPPFASAASVFAYGGPAQDAVSRWKNRPAEWLGRPLSEAFADAFREVVGEDAVVIPIPSAPARLYRRGFNPPSALSRELASRARAHHRPGALRLVKTPATSRRLSRRERLMRMNGAFQALRQEVAGRHVLLVDDVMTTGATLRAASAACLDAGATRVDARVLARVPAQ